MSRNHNDFEIIARIKEGDEQALELMVSKYEKFIAKKIYKFNLAYDYEDLFQEGIILLYKSALNFDESFNKTFTRFYEMNLERYFITYINTMKRRKEKTVHNQTIIAEMNHCIRENSVYYNLHVEEIKTLLTPLEFSIYSLRELKNFSVEAIAQKYALDEKKIYNALHRAKTKIHAYFK